MKTGIFLCALLIAISSQAQTEDAYQTDDTQQKTGLTDPSRLSINHALSFGAASYSGYSGLKSQSLYSTMMQYRFMAPVTLNLNFGLPIHSTFSSAQNLTADNLQSLDYFKSIPFDFSLTWQPSEKLMMRFSVVKQSYSDFYYNDYPVANDLMQRNPAQLPSR